MSPPFTRSVVVFLLAVALTGCRSGQPAHLAGRRGVTASTVTAGSSTTPPPPSTPVTTNPPEPLLPPPPTPERVSLPRDTPLAPVLSRVPTTQPVVFVTIDDGWVRDPGVVTLVRSRQVPVSAFLIARAAAEDPAYFRAVVDGSGAIEDHTLTHPRMPRLSLATQRAQICGAADEEARLFGTRPTLFRPPYGAMNTLTRAAAAACGMHAVVRWSATMDRGELSPHRGLRAGDIVLLHFRPTLRADLSRLLDEIARRNLAVGRLESYVG